MRVKLEDLTMDALLEKIREQTECSLYITLNDHNNFYEDATEYYEKRDLLEDQEIDLDRDIWAIQWYSRTPVGFYYILTNDIRKGLIRLLEG